MSVAHRIASSPATSGLTGPALHADDVQALLAESHRLRRRSEEVRRGMVATSDRVRASTALTAGARDRRPRDATADRAGVVTRPDAAPAPVDDGESEDERIERRAAEALARRDEVLRRLRLTPDESAFARDTGDRVVDLVGDAFLAALRDGKPLRGTCVAASVAAALAVAHDPADGG